MKNQSSLCIRVSVPRNASSVQEFQYRQSQHSVTNRFSFFVFHTSLLNASISRFLHSTRVEFQGVLGARPRQQRSYRKSVIDM